MKKYYCDICRKKITKSEILKASGYTEAHLRCRRKMLNKFEMYMKYLYKIKNQKGLMVITGKNG